MSSHADLASEHLEAQTSSLLNVAQVFLNARDLFACHEETSQSANRNETERHGDHQFDQRNSSVSRVSRRFAFCHFLLKRCCGAIGACG